VPIELSRAFQYTKPFLRVSIHLGTQELSELLAKLFKVNGLLFHRR
jgi:hypothetical protein